jgi:hypothetical protein
MSRLSSLGRELYERVAHRGEPSHPAAPLAISDSEPTSPFMRGDAERGEPERAQARPPEAERAEAKPADAEPPTDDDLEVAQDLGGLDVEQLAYGEDAQTPADPEVAIKDSGDLYGIHIAPASDRAQQDDDAAFDAGQNWIEALETRAAEGGPEPEREIEIVDDEDVTSPSSDMKDRPIADRGSAGPRGL